MAVSDNTGQQPPPQEEPSRETPPKAWAIPVTKVLFTNREEHVHLDTCYKKAIRAAIESTHHPDIQQLARCVVASASKGVSVGLQVTNNKLLDAAKNIKTSTATEEEVDWYKKTTAELASFGILSQKDLQDIIPLLDNENKGSILLSSVLFSVALDNLEIIDWDLTTTFPVQLLTAIHDYFTQNEDPRVVDLEEDGEDKKFISRAIFIRYQRWSIDVAKAIQGENQFDILKDKKAHSALYHHTPIDRIRGMSVQDFRDIFMGNIAEVVNKHKQDLLLAARSEQENNNQTNSHLSSPSNSFLSNRSVRLPDHPDDFNCNMGAILPIKNEFYEMLNALSDSFSDTQEIWDMVNAQTPLSDDYLNMIDGTILCFLEAYKYFKENFGFLKHETNPYKKENYHTLYDKFNLQSVRQNPAEIILIKSAISTYQQELTEYNGNSNVSLTARTSNTPARTLVEMLGGPENWPSRKLGYLMKSAENLAYTCTAEPYYKVMKAQEKVKALDTFNNGQVSFFLVGFTNIIPSETDTDNYEVVSSIGASKAFVWLPNHPFHSTASNEVKKAGVNLLYNKLPNIKTALKEYADNIGKDIPPTTNNNTMCSHDALKVIEFFTSKEPNRKVISAYNQIQSMSTTPNSRNTASKRARSS